MPQAADLEEALNKKGGLTLSQLANYDDIITDALVDRVCIRSEKKMAQNADIRGPGLFLVDHP